MPVYHPALDPYHSAFRMLQVLARDPQREYDVRALRILDFYAVFPHLIAGIRLPNQYRSTKKQFSDLRNSYWFSGDPVLVFARMEPLQQTAVNLLYAQGLVDVNEYSKGLVRIVVEQFEKMSLPPPTTISRGTLEFLVTVLGTMALLGSGGLKDRTGLLEYRYDSL